MVGRWDEFAKGLNEVAIAHLIRFKPYFAQQRVVAKAQAMGRKSRRRDRIVIVLTKICERRKIGKRQQRIRRGQKRA